VQGTLPIGFGDLILHDLSATPDYNNLTVRQALAALNSALAGLPTTDSIADLDDLTHDINAAFFMASPSQFAQDHLNAPVPEPSTLTLMVTSIAGIAAARRSQRD